MLLPMSMPGPPSPKSVAGTAVEGVVALAGEQGVVTLARVERVHTGATYEHVGARTADHLVVAVATIERHLPLEWLGVEAVVAGTAGQLECFNAREGVETGPGERAVGRHEVCVDRLGEGVVAAAARNLVVPEPAGEQVVLQSADEDVVL